MQSGESGSVTVTSLSVVLPLFVTVILNEAVSPLAIVCDDGSLMIAIDGRGDGAGVTGGFGVGGGVIGAVTVTGAVSVAETGLPFGSRPVAVATFVKLAVTLASEQL